MKTEDSRFHSFGDAELLRLMALQDDSAFEAWEEFYRRHVKYLYGVSQRAFTGIVGSNKIEDVVHDTFVKAFHKASKFRSEENSDTVGQRRSVRAWLGKISENIVRDYFRGQPEVNFVDEDALDVYEASRPYRAEESDCDQSSELELLEAALETLTESEQHVLRTTGLWYKPGQKAQRLPNKVMVELATSLNTNAANVRKIRSRGVAKVKEYFEAHPEGINT